MKLKMMFFSLVFIMLLAGCNNAGDKIPPQIKVKNENVVLKYGAKFDPQSGVSATDDISGDITKDIMVVKNEVKTNEPGEYMVEFRVKDKAGNETSKTINVLVQSQVKTPTTTTSPNTPTPTKPPSTSTAPSKKVLSSSVVYYWIQERYIKYDVVYNNGKDAGDTYTREVFLDAADYFGAPVSEVKKAYDAFRY